MNRITILQGDVLERLKELPDESVHCVVTSPPYWGLRDYGVEGQIGLEPTLQEFVDKMVEVFREVRRVLRKDGVCFVNLGDAYMANASSQAPQTKSHKGSGFCGPNRKPQVALKPKDLCGVPWRVALALQADGWWLRSDIIWAKANPMPESVTDRPTRSHEYIFLLTKSQKYFWDQEAVREGPVNYSRKGGKANHTGDSGHTHGVKSQTFHQMAPNGRNLRTVWTIPTESFTGSHFATFPKELVRCCVAAGTSEKGCCPACGAPWKRVVEKGKLVPDKPGYKPRGNKRGDSFVKNAMTPAGETQGFPNAHYERTTLGWQPTCKCPQNNEGLEQTMAAVVFDPFCGSGTTALVSASMARDAIGIELNPDYCDMAVKRIRRALGMMVEIEHA